MRDKVIVLPLDHGAFLYFQALRIKLHIAHRHFHDRERGGFCSSDCLARKGRFGRYRFRIRVAPVRRSTNLLTRSFENRFSSLLLRSSLFKSIFQPTAVGTN
jgi:hypothetical protein